MSRLRNWACVPLIALAGMMVAAAPAAADAVLPLQNYAVGGSIHLAKLGDTVNLPAGSTFNGSADVTTGKLTGDVSIPEFSTTIPVLGLPARATLQLVESQPSAGTFTLNANGTITVNATSTATLYIRRLGLLFVSVPSTCRTSAPIVLALDGTGSLTAGFAFAGTTTISPLTGCGVLGPALSLLLSGPGNAYHITLTPPSG